MEKDIPTTTHTFHNGHQEALDGYVRDTHELRSDEDRPKTAADGHTVLNPQPTGDPNDPHNWTSRKKHTILLAIAAVSLLPDYGTAMGSVTQIPQAKYWHMSVTTIQESVAVNTLLVGLSSLLIVACSDFFGRAPVLFWSRVVVLAACIWYAKADTFSSFYGARIVMAIFVGPGQAGGLMWIKDMFFFHELPRKINIWSGFIIISPYLGPFVASFVIWRLLWRWVYWIYAIENYIGFFIVLFLIDETFYDRNIPTSKQPPWRSRLMRLTGFERHGRYSLLSAIARPLVAISKLPVLLIVVYYFLNFAWTIGVNATIATWLSQKYHFNGKETGFFYFAPMIGSVVGTIAGHWLHDLVGKIYLRKYGKIDPEVRLYVTYGAGLLTGTGILVLGFALENHWHYMVVAVMDGVQLIGVNIISTAVNAYLLDAYPEASGEVDAWIVVGRTTGGFMATYIDLPWVESAGPARALGTQAAITWGALAVVVFLQIFGKRLRQLQGPMKFPGEK